MRILDIVEIRIAGPHDAEALYALRSDWELWFDARGIEQWNVGEVPVEFIAAQVEAGEWFVGVDATGAVIGGLRYLTTDPEVWTEETDAAARYVHGLMVDRRRAAPKSGALLLAWAEARAVAEGIALMRLDCVESNSWLRSYYRAAGYLEVGRHEGDGPWFSATLFEKDLIPGRPSQR